jgi:hypothetical protein
MSHLIYHPFDTEFINSFNVLGPFPMVDSDVWNPFSVHCLEKEVAALEAGNLVIFPDGSWVKDFLVDAVFIVTDMVPQGALLDRVWRGPEMLEMELEKARELARDAAIEAMNLGEEEPGEGDPPMVPDVVVPGDVYVPRKVLLSRTTKVFALNLTGVALVRDGGLGPGFSIPVEVVPKAVKWVTIPENAIVPPSVNPSGSIQLVMPPNSYQPMSYKNQQSLLALHCFKLLVGFNMSLYDVVVSTLTTIDINCAHRLAMRPNITVFMRQATWVANSKLLIALMSANFSIHRDPGFGQMSLLDFSSTGKEWTEVGPFWDDLYSAGFVLDHLFRSGAQFFMILITMANQALNAVTLDISASAKFSFITTQMGILWLKFGLFIKNHKHMLCGIDEFDDQCKAMFSFTGVDLCGLLQNVRNISMDQVISDHAKEKAKRGRSFQDNGSPDRRPPKRPGVAGVPNPKGNKPKGFCINYYAFLAKAPHGSGGVYPDCSNKQTCSRFSHVAVTASNKGAISDCILDKYADLRVKAVVMGYLATF